MSNGFLDFVMSYLFPFIIGWICMSFVFDKVRNRNKVKEEEALGPWDPTYGDTLFRERQSTQGYNRPPPDKGKYPYFNRRKKKQSSDTDLTDAVVAGTTYHYFVQSQSEDSDANNCRNETTGGSSYSCDFSPD